VDNSPSFARSTRTTMIFHGGPANVRLKRARQCRRRQNFLHKNALFMSQQAISNNITGAVESEIDDASAWLCALGSATYSKLPNFAFIAKASTMDWRLWACDRSRTRSLKPPVFGAFVDAAAPDAGGGIEAFMFSIDLLRRRVPLIEATYSACSSSFTPVSSSISENKEVSVLECAAGEVL
jgi:hypothetical protein